MAAERSVLVRLLANISDFKAQMDTAKRSVKGVGDESDKSSQQASTALGRMAQSAQKNREAWDTAGKSLVAFGAVAAVAIGASVKAAMDWESAWAGVTKTVSGTPRQLGEVETGLRGLARTLPSTHDEIAAVAEAAGQLGVKTDSIVDFTRTMIDLGQTTNLSADEAATSLAQLMNVMGTAPKDVGRLGAALVALGNDGASTEADIVRMASYITGSAKLIGASESDVLALANAMTSMGINAERGGGVMTRVMQDVYAAVQSGGAQLEGFAKVAGMSSQEFARAFEDDPVRAIDSFIRGLNDVEASGGNVVETLGNLGYIGTQDTAVLLQMKGAGDLLTRSLDLGSEAWEQNSALVLEAAKRYDTTASQMAIARNNIHDAAIEVGEVFLPVLADLAGGLADVAGWFADLPDPVKGTIGALTGVVGVTALAGGGFLLLFPRVIETYKAFQTLHSVSPGVATGLGRVGKAAAIAGVVAAAAAAVWQLSQAGDPAVAGMEKTTKALLDLGDGAASVDALLQGSSPAYYHLEGLADAAERLTKPDLNEKLNNFWGEIATFGSSEGAPGRDKLIKQLDMLGESLAMQVESGNTEMAAAQFKALSEEWKSGGGSVEDLMELMPAYGEALDGVDNKQTAAAQSAQTQAEKAALLAQNLDATYGSLEGYAAALGMDEEATKALIEKSNELGESLAGFVDPLGVYTAMLDAKIAKEQEASGQTDATGQAGQAAWQQFADGAGLSIDQYLIKLEEQLTAQQNWQVNMLILAGRVSQGTLDELARMGPEGAPLVADLVTASDAELARFETVTAARSKAATDAWGAQLTMAAPVLAAVGKMAGQGVVNELAAQLQAGTTTVAAIAAKYGISLAGGINPVLTGLGRPPIAAPAVHGPAQSSGGYANGAVVDFYADGTENHVAQIAPAGAWRVWAEPETGGEAYIPLASSKRGRSVDIWREVGKRLGVEFQEFAFGGINDVPHPPSTAPFRSPISTVADATMQREYDEITAWLKAHTESIQGGTPGTGSVGGAWQSIFTWVKERVPQARVNSAYRPGDPGYHGRGKAVDFGFGSGPGGNGSAGLALINRLLHDGIGGTLAELIYDGIGDDRPDLYHGKPHTYNAGTRAEHHNHVHAAVFGKGGILNPHIRDAGGPLLPGYTFNGTGGLEDVVPRNARMVDVSSLRAFEAPSGPASPSRFEGDLYLDSGEFLGKVRGVAAAVIDQRNDRNARDLRSSL